MGHSLEELFGVFRLGQASSRRQAGLAPGTVAVRDDAPDLHIEWLRYGSDALHEHSVDSHAPLAGQLAAVLDGGEGVTWLQVTGLGDADRLVELGKALKLHPLTLEDIANLDQRPKVETFDDDWLAFVRCCDEKVDEDSPLRTWQIALLLRPGLVVTFSEAHSDVFEPVLRRLRAGNPRIRGLGSDYLAYALLDAVVDRYQLVLDSFRDLLDAMEEVVLDDTVDLDLQHLHRVRRDLLRLGRVVPPVRDLLGEMLLERSRSDGAEGTRSPFSRPVRVFLRDCHDHALRAADLVDSYRDLAAGLLDLHLSVVGYRTNEVMKVLTMIATIFIPLSFLAGLYGMNFDTTSAWNLPELGWAYGYPLLLGVMAVVAGTLVMFFRRRGWL